MQEENTKYRLGQDNRARKSGLMKGKELKENAKREGDCGRGELK